MRLCFRVSFYCLCTLAAAGLHAAAPPLLVRALQHWSEGQGELAFTQQTRVFLADGDVKEERVERYDPSLPDSQRWRLIELNGQPATDEQSRKWETRKNSRPRKKVDESPAAYLDLDHAAVTSETARDVRFRIPIRPETKRLIDVENIDVVVTVDKQTGNVAGVGAALREPIRMFLGAARITDLDVNLRINPEDEGSGGPSDEVESGSTVRVKISKLGRPVEYDWSDFKRVASFPGS
jgi:hypothetical protein